MKKIYEHFFKNGTSEFKYNEFQSIENNPDNPMKPRGGLWASPVRSPNGWKSWCIRENMTEWIENGSFIFFIKPDSRVLEIRNPEDLNDLPRVNYFNGRFSEGTADLDFETLSKKYDAIELFADTSEYYSPINGLYWDLYGWDCSCILIMNPNIIEVISECKAS